MRKDDVKGQVDAAQDVNTPKFEELRLLRSQVDAAPGVNTLSVEKPLLERCGRCRCVRTWRPEGHRPPSEEGEDEGTLSARRRCRTAKRRETRRGKYESARQTAPFCLHWQ